MNIKGLELFKNTNHISKHSSFRINTMKWFPELYTFSRLLYPYTLEMGNNFLWTWRLHPKINFAFYTMPTSFISLLESHKMNLWLWSKVNLKMTQKISNSKAWIRVRKISLKQTLYSPQGREHKRSCNSEWTLFVSSPTIFFSQWVIIYFKPLRLFSY